VACVHGASTSRACRSPLRRVTMASERHSRPTVMRRFSVCLVQVHLWRTCRPIVDEPHCSTLSDPNQLRDSGRSVVGHTSVSVSHSIRLWFTRTSAVGCDRTRVVMLGPPSARDAVFFGEPHALFPPHTPPISLPREQIFFLSFASPAIKRCEPETAGFFFLTEMS
jgi:hypothetical protein